jgi:hypothetical protein
MNQYKLRMTGNQYDSLFSHLFPGDNKEAVSVALCGVGELANGKFIERVITVYKIKHIPYEECLIRTENKVKWSTAQLNELLEEALKKNLVVMKIHSHPSGWASFSESDEISDRDFFEGVSGWLQKDFPGISAIMLPCGRILARAFDINGNTFPIKSVLITGDDIKVWHADENSDKASEDSFQKRTEQAFGKGTTSLLSKLTVGIVGVSGTGSPVAEMLYRLGIGKLVLIDDDVVEGKNVGRIYNSTLKDAEQSRFKVDVIEEAIRKSGLPTEVKAIRKNLFHIDVVQELTQCDVVIGCMDSVDGRDLLNRISIFYSLPYFDLGVHLEADGMGGVDLVSGAVQYVKPDGSTLLNRKAYTNEDLRASHMKRTNPKMYKEMLKEGYIKGVNEDRPAVISVNTLIASLAVNEFLARVHPFRYFNNSDVAVVRFNLSDLDIEYQADTSPKCPILSKEVGRGDTWPLLGILNE